jgi:hypothetical protein
MKTSVEKMIEQYVSAWNENSLELYQREFAKCWAKDAVYIDPYSEVNGLDALADFAYKSLGIMPTRKFSILEKPEFHNTFGKYVWKVEIGEQTNTGLDYFEFNDNFEITRLISFFKLPEDYPLERLS